uniref:Uncharacterized protein n=1 Tax=Arundo donax TaxID=35708 RepID=A0A0A9AFK9_ARUDO
MAKLSNKKDKILSHMKPLLGNMQWKATY